MSAHLAVGAPRGLAVAALRGDNPKHGCRDCPRNVPWCRGAASLNGPEAAHEFARPLHPRVRADILNPEQEK
jgi:hypothetical protein